MVKLRSDLVRYLTAAELRVLQAVETGMRSYAYVPAAHSVARAWLLYILRGGGADQCRRGRRLIPLGRG